MSKDSLTVTDNRTGKTYEIPVEGGSIRTMDLRQIKTSDDDFGLLSYDPGLVNTASCKSAVTFIDGSAGILRYRGYPVAELGFRYDAHPMGILVGTIGALSTFYPDAKKIESVSSRRLQIRRLIGKMPTIAAYAYRHSLGLPYVGPDNELSYVGNFLSMLFKMTELRYKPNPVYERALEVLFILHADHEQNCSTTAVRNVGSSHADPYSAVAAATAALYGPLHGGANEAVIRMLTTIGSKDDVPKFIESVKSGEGRLMGFGHRVYKSYDPRAKIIKDIAYEVFDETGKNPLIDIALELERIALEDDYFISRKLYPNVDFYSGIIYQAMGFPKSMFPVLFAIPRVSGWLAQWVEMVCDEEQKIVRPRQLYTGEDERHYTPIASRPVPDTVERIMMAGRL
jgi:citrate synthase